MTINAYESIHTGQEHDTYVTKNELINLIYPIGSIYISTNSSNPSLLFGGSWTQIEDTFLLAAGNNYIAGSTGGEATHTLTISETPAHTHSRGTMNITGTYKTGWGDASGGGIISQNWSGAMYGTRDGSAFYYNAGNVGYSSTSDAHRNLINFDASRNWTGETSSIGSDGAHNNMPPYLAVYVFKRIS